MNNITMPSPIKTLAGERGMKPDIFQNHQIYGLSSLLLAYNHPGQFSLTTGEPPKDFMGGYLPEKYRHLIWLYGSLWDKVKVTFRGYKSGKVMECRSLVVLRTPSDSLQRYAQSVFHFSTIHH